MTTSVGALGRFTKELKKYPFPSSLIPIRQKWEELSSSGYFTPQSAPWFSAFQLANLVKFLVIYGAERARRPTFDLAKPFNLYKDFWAAAESEAEYSDNSEHLAAFIFRFLYQQIPYLIHRCRVPQLFEAARLLYFDQSQSPGGPQIWSNSDFQTRNGLPLDAFLRISQSLWLFFVSRIEADTDSLMGCLDKADQQYFHDALRVLAANRTAFKKSFNQSKATLFREIPYEFNPLLRSPILVHDSKFWAPIPELIAYAATRGLYFQLCDSFGEPFKKRFGDMFSAYAVKLFSDRMNRSEILMEADERAMGWKGKTNDFTVLTERRAFLFECKASALFYSSKREATVESIAADIRKNLANPKHRSGVFQLHDKIDAIRNSRLPPCLNDIYNRALRFFPVLLLYDRIGYANHPQTLRNLVDAELRRSGIQEFDYQIWHVEEIEHLFEVLPENEVADALEDKFVNAAFRDWDLDTYLFERTQRRLQYLRISCCVPKGETQALKIIRSLADKT